MPKWYDNKSTARPAGGLFFCLSRKTSFFKIILFWQFHSITPIPKNQYFSKSFFFGIGQNKSLSRWFFQIESDIRLNRAELPYIASNGKINIISLPRQKTRYKPKFSKTEKHDGIRTSGRNPGRNQAAIPENFNFEKSRKFGISKSEKINFEK